LEQIVLIDDSAAKCRHEQHRIENHISLPPFKVLDPKVNHTQDRCLSDLAAFLESQLAPTIEDGLAGEAGSEVNESLAIRNEEEGVHPDCNDEDEDEEKDSVGDGLDDDYLDDYDSKLEEIRMNVLAGPKREAYTGIAAKDLVAAYRKSQLVDGNTASLT
jgi:hypothetical protein